jgi:hypothetical protein
VESAGGAEATRIEAALITLVYSGRRGSTFGSVTFELGRALLLSGAVSADKLAEALYVVATQGIPLARALVGLGAIDEARLEEELARAMPTALTHVEPLPQMIARLPPGLCHRLAAAPIAVDTATGAVEVAVLDPREGHAADEVGYHLRSPVRARRASYAALREALDRYPGGLLALAAPMGTPFDPNGPLSSVQRRAAFPDGAFLLQRKPGGAHPDREEPRFKTRLWDSTDPSEPASFDEASWDSEPVFELRRLGPPPTVQDPEPVTTRLLIEEQAVPLVRTSRAPIAPQAPPLPFADLGSTLASIRAGTDRDGVLSLVQLGVRSVARRVALLVVRKEGLAGWSCTPEFGDEATLKKLKIPTLGPNSLAPLLSGDVHLGPLPASLAASLLPVMRTASLDVAVAALRVADRPAVFIVADELGDTLLATKRLEELARAGGEALLRILRTPRD